MSFLLQEFLFFSLLPFWFSFPSHLGRVSEWLYGAELPTGAKSQQVTHFTQPNSSRPFCLPLGCHENAWGKGYLSYLGQSVLALDRACSGAVALSAPTLNLLFKSPYARGLMLSSSDENKHLCMCEHQCCFHSSKWADDKWCDMMQASISFPPQIRWPPLYCLLGTVPGLFYPSNYVQKLSGRAPTSSGQKH